MFQNMSLIALGLLVGLSLGMYAFFTRNVPPVTTATAEIASVQQPVAAAEEIQDPVVITAPPMTAAEMLAAQVLPGQEQPQVVEEAPAPPVTAVQPPVPAVQTAATAPADILGEETVPAAAPAIAPNATTEIVATGTGGVLSDLERRRIQEAQEDAGWANAKFLPKEALEVIQPPIDDKITE